MHAGLEIHGWKNTWHQESTQVVLALRLVSRFPVVRRLHDSSSQRDTGGITVKPQQKDATVSFLVCHKQDKCHEPKDNGSVREGCGFFHRDVFGKGKQ